MERRIIGFRQDEDGQWIAELSCGHAQHVRHDPPWQVRPWVMLAETRTARLGTVLECPLCSRSPEDEASAYLDAQIRGLCADGAAEAARPRRRRHDDQIS
jgi:uncharacterized protein DUF3565